MFILKGGGAKVLVTVAKETVQARRRLPAGYWRKTPPGFQFLFFRRCF